MKKNDYFIIQQISQPQVKLDPLSPVMPQFSRKQGIELHPKAEGVLQSSFICGIFGSPGAGKSTLIAHLLLQQQIFNQRFQRVLFIGPTVYPYLLQDEHNHQKNLDMNWIMKQIQQANEWSCVSMLIVFDDVVSSIKASSNSILFQQLFNNRRHLLNKGTINIILTSQKWNMVPPFIRCIMNLIIMFPTAKQQIQVFCRDVNLTMPKRMIAALFAQKKKNEFLFFNLQSNKCFDHNWKQL